MNKKTAAKAAVINASEKTTIVQTPTGTKAKQILENEIKASPVKEPSLAENVIQPLKNSFEKTKKEATEQVKITKEKAVEVAKTTAKKAAKTKETIKKAVSEETIQVDTFIQYMNEQTVLKEVVEDIKEEYVAQGHRIATLKTMEIYLKPEEYKAYYVINKKIEGSIPLFH